MVGYLRNCASVAFLVRQVWPTSNLGRIVDLESVMRDKIVTRA